MKVRKILLAVIFSLIPVTSHAITGMALYEGCSSVKGSTGDLLCTGYVRGFMDGLEAGSITSFKYTQFRACPPANVLNSTPQSRLIIEKYLGNHPEQLDKEAGGLAMLAMNAAFPCPSK